MKLPSCYLLLATTIVGLSLSGNASAQTLLLEYKFNETGNSAFSNGSISSSSSTATLYDAVGTASDLHTSAGGGVSGLPGDRAFNNSGSSGMGTGNTGGYTTTPTLLSTGIGSLSSFTIQGWFKTDGVVIQNGAKLFEVFNPLGTGILLNSEVIGQLTLNVDGVKALSPAVTGYYGNSAWVFFAVTYDGTVTTNNVNFYYGTTGSSVSLVSGGTKTLNAGTTGTTGVGLGLADNYNSNARPFDGYMDDVRLFGATSGTGGVLSQSQLEQYRLADIANVPEPSTVGLFLASLGLLIYRYRGARQGGARTA